MTGDETDLLEPRGRVEDARKRPNEPLNASERERPECKNTANSLSEASNPGDTADALGASDCDEDTRKQLKNLFNGSEHELKRSERRDEETQPKRALDELDGRRNGRTRRCPE
jgi:hypothetical protein